MLLPVKLRSSLIYRQVQDRDSNLPITIQPAVSRNSLQETIQWILLGAFLCGLFLECRYRVINPSSARTTEAFSITITMSIFQAKHRPATAKHTSPHRNITRLISHPTSSPETIINPSLRRTQYQPLLSTPQLQRQTGPTLRTSTPLIGHVGQANSSSHQALIVMTAKLGCELSKWHLPSLFS